MPSNTAAPNTNRESSDAASATDLILPDSIAGLVSDLRNQIASRVSGEEQLRAAYAPTDDPVEQQLRQAAARCEEEFQARAESMRGEYESSREAVVLQCDAEYAAMRAEYDAARAMVVERTGTAEKEAASEHEEAQWLISSVLDDKSENNPKFKFQQFQGEITRTKERLEAQRRELDERNTKLVEQLKKTRQWREFEGLEQAHLPKTRTELQAHFLEVHTAAMERMGTLEKHKLSQLFKGMVPFAIGLVVTVMVGGGLAFIDPSMLGIAASRMDPVWLGIIAGASLLVGLGFVLILYAMSRGSTGRQYQAIRQLMAEANASSSRWIKLAQEEIRKRHAEYEKSYAAVLEKREQALQLAEQKREQKQTDITAERATELKALDAKYPKKLQQLVTERDSQLKVMDETYQRQVNELQQWRAGELQRIEQQRTSHRGARGEAQVRDFDSVSKQWRGGISRFASRADAAVKTAHSKIATWSEFLDDKWNLPNEIPSAIPLGRFDLDLAQLENAVPADPRLKLDRTQFELPSLLKFPEQASVLLKATGAGRDVAVDVLRKLMLRLLTSLPPGKVRFTIVDPVGLGENFSAFMHLADFDEKIINTRIWTESSHIERRLAELTEHMENVFQAYLRNEYATIEEYNHHAGEVAEPYRVLVIANFPTNITEGAARRLVSIAASGARCGVYTLVSVDTKQPMPHGFDLADLEANATTFNWRDGHFYPAEGEMSQFPVTLEKSPGTDDFIQVVRSVGRQSQDARRVEVSFERIAPKPNEFWNSNSGKGLNVPIGRAGATKLQHLALGKGTSQHVLVAGKTGSGKSSFLHALVTNLALHYGPDEIQFYLVDFKKGVEFKTYATHSMPHARAIAIESDREFGISVLERLDRILKERGDLFRDAGVQDLGAYRAATGKHEPRIMLVVDEFQEFFVEDDMLAQQATLLLDRLVRQGRAFGVHVLLGSQTLGGAYSLARSTLGQVAVRVALQCSEADAHLILSEENTAARLLSRPGEAIYNDANGLLEGNHPFQIAWLPDDTRERYLIKLHELAEQRNVDVEPPIVFEGNIASDASRNRALVRAIETFDASAGRPRQEQREFSAWLGEAVAIQDPTRVVFSRRSGTNILIVGPQPDSAFGLCAASACAMGAQMPVSSDDSDSVAQLYFLDGDVVTGNESQQWGQLSKVLPQRVVVTGQDDSTPALSDVAAEVTRRQDANDRKAPPIFVFVWNLGRFRDLKKDEDEFGFGSSDPDKPVSGGKLLGDILKDGPAVGVHTIVWCDTFGNVSRWLSNAAVREFELRVAFQMNATDSSNFIDSPAASKLGPHRALLLRAEQGSTEKFRPYGKPSDDWLKWVEEHLGSADSPRPAAKQPNELPAGDVTG